MNRIISQNRDVCLTVKDILDSYSRTELKPVAGHYLINQNGKMYGCLISSLWMDTLHIEATAYENPTEEDILYFTESAIDSANKRFGPDNVIALLLGFDNLEPKGTYFTFSEREYYEIGRLAAQQLGLHKGNLKV